MASILFLSCSKEATSVTKSSLCDNELTLLGSFEPLPHLSINIHQLRDSPNVSLDSLFENYGFEIFYKVEHSFGDDDKVVLKMTSVDLDRYLPAPPPFNPFVNWIHVYLTKSDSLIVRNKVGSMETLSEKVRDRYLDLSEDRYELVNIALLWDYETASSTLNQVVTEIIRGYLGFANEYSVKSFGKVVCELNPGEISTLSEIVPFNLRTDFYEGSNSDFWTLEKMDELLNK